MTRKILIVVLLFTIFGGGFMVLARGNDGNNDDQEKTGSPSPGGKKNMGGNILDEENSIAEELLGQDRNDKEQPDPDPVIWDIINEKFYPKLIRMIENQNVNTNTEPYASSTRCKEQNGNSSLISYEKQSKALKSKDTLEEKKSFLNTDACMFKLAAKDALYRLYNLEGAISKANKHEIMRKFDIDGANV